MSRLAINRNHAARHPAALADDICLKELTTSRRARHYVDMQDNGSPKNPTAQAISGAVRAMMARRKISQKDLRAGLGWSVSYLGRRLSGELEMSVSDLIAISGVVGCDPVHLVAVAIEDLTPVAVA